MKYIFNFTKFVNEALRDEISDHHKDVLTNNIFKYKPEEDTELDDLETIVPDEVLDSDIPKKSENIREGIWKLSEEDKDRAIKIMFEIDIPLVEQMLGKFNPPEDFLKILKESATIEIDILKPSIKDIKNAYGNNFRLLNVNETKSDKKHSRDAKGVPLRDAKGNFIMMKKEIGEPVFTNNISDFNALAMSYFNCVNDDFYNPYLSKEFKKIYSKISAISQNKFDIDILSNFDLELYISSKPSDMLNMSLSAFYDSCQNLYNGTWRHRITANLFDVNCKICYLRFNTPFEDKTGNEIPFTSFSRCLIRNIKGKLYFDPTYPDLKGINIFHHSMITKYTGMLNNYSGDKYYYKKTVNGVPGPYLDRLKNEPINDNSSDPKVVALSKALDLDIDYIDKIGNCQYVYKDDVDRKFYIFDMNKASDETVILERMMFQLRLKFATLYKVDDWEHYINIDELKAMETDILIRAIDDYNDDEDDADVETIYKALKRTNMASKISKFFAPYIDDKFFQVVLRDWKTQMVRVLSRDNKEIKYENYVIIERF